jgi:hypothetical protein
MHRSARIEHRRQRHEPIRAVIARCAASEKKHRYARIEHRRQRYGDNRAVMRVAQQAKKGTDNARIERRRKATLQFVQLLRHGEGCRNEANHEPP